ncbi:MAG: right-handed parallel beta-helix repeat-containing protein [Desulfobacterales bacterium]|nr:right-handed parallel beta-helix repeat-containing protein [Desulfobacterales bacterium]
MLLGPVCQKKIEYLTYGALIKIAAFTLIFVFILSFGSSAFAATWFVRSDLAVSGDGTSWSEAFTGIAEAVSAATAGDDIWVQAGTYSPASTIWVTKAVILLGGFEGFETEASQRNFVSNETIVDGGDAIRIMNVSASATLDGFTFTNGSDSRAGAMVISESGSEPNILNCKFTHNASTGTGGSEGYYGGGAVWLSYAKPVFNNCVFAQNTALDYGGAINAGSGSMLLINCTFTRNTAYTGGAVYILGDTDIKHRIYNSILWGNTNTTGSDLEVRFSSTDWPDGSNNCCSSYVGSAQVYTDPLIIDPDNGNYHIAPGSPCIDQGTSSVGLLPIDIDGDPRQLDGDSNGSVIVDIGADEFDPSQDYYADLYVDGIDGDDLNDGTTWAAAKASLQAAIGAAAENNEIWVRGGNYDLTSPVNVDKVLFIYGGFAGTEIQRNSRNWLANPTIINGQSTFQCLYITGAAKVDGFTFTNGIAVNGGGILASASGATIANSIIQNCSAEYGGGIYCGRTTYLNDCSILNNSAGQSGGGIYTISSSSTTVSNCLIAGNTADRSTDGGGGGIYNDGGFSPLIENCIIRGNSTAGHGGGIHNNERNEARIFACTITLNEASNRGGGIYSGQNGSTNYSRPDIINCVIANNHAVYGGGIYSDEASNSDIFNCTIAGNTAATYGAGLYLAYRNSYAYVMNCIFMGNVLDGGGYSDIYFVYYGGLTGSSFNNLRLLYNDFSMLDESWHNAGAPYKTGNMGVSPDFVDYDGPDNDPLAGGDSDYHLSPSSPVIDEGIASDATFNLTAPSDDLDGTSRPQGMGYDLGAYEYLVTTPIYTLTASVISGSGTVSPTSGDYFEGTVVSLTADPDAGYQVASWSGTDDDSSTAGSNTVTMTGDKSVSVSFETIPVTQYTLTVTKSGSGTISPAEGSHVYDAGIVVDLTADPDAGYQVASWSGTDDDSSTAGSNTVTMTGDKSVSVSFETIPVTQYTLTVTKSGSGTISPAEGSHVYDAGTVVDLTADPDAGYQVASWSGTDDDSSTAGSNTVTMTGDKSVSVSFETIPVTQYTLTVTKSGSGTISPAEGSHVYDAGIVVDLTADPDAGYQVAAWSGTDDDSSTAQTNTVTMDSNKSVSVAFRPEQQIMPGVLLLLLEDTPF